MGATNPGALTIKVQNLIAGLKTLPASFKMRLGGVDYTTTTVLAEMQKGLDPLVTTASLRQQLKESVATQNATKPATEDLVALVVAYLVLYYGENSASLAGFGIKGKKARTPLTTEEKLVAKAKAGETRKLRGTLGSKQKKAIKATGTPIVNVSVPPEPSAPSAAISTPAPPAGDPTPTAASK